MLLTLIQRYDKNHFILDQEVPVQSVVNFLTISKLISFNSSEVRQEVNIGIKHGFSCINIRQIPWEVLKTEAVAVFNTSHGTWRMLMDWKTMFNRYYCIKTENNCYISRYLLHYFVSPFHRCFANVISTDYARSRAGQYTSRDGSKSIAPVRSSLLVEHSCGDQTIRIYTDVRSVLRYIIRPDWEVSVIAKQLLW